MDETQILELKEKIEESKSRLSEYKGRLQGLMDDLNSKWNCTTVKQAKAEREKMLQKQEELKQQIEEGLEELEQELGDEVENL